MLCNMANEFTRRGHIVSIICCDPKVGMPFYSLDKRVILYN